MLILNSSGVAGCTKYYHLLVLGTTNTNGGDIINVMTAGEYINCYMVQFIVMLLLV